MTGARILKLEVRGVRKKGQSGQHLDNIHCQAFHLFPFAFSLGPRAYILRKTTVPFVPPKPKELDSATSIFISRAVFGT